MSRIDFVADLVHFAKFLMSLPVNLLALRPEMIQSLVAGGGSNKKTHEQYLVN